MAVRSAALGQVTSHHWGDVQKVAVDQKIIESIFPRVVVLDNGMAAFLRSRPGTSVVFSPEGAATVWTDELQFYQDIGCMNALRKIGTNQLLSAYIDTRRHQLLATINVTKKQQISRWP